MAQSFSDYLHFLDGLGEIFDQLCVIEQDKVSAVRAGSLDKLNECIRQEQAVSLKLKGCEQRQRRMLEELGLANVTLRELSRHCPPELREDAQRTIDRLLRKYQVLRSAQEPARILMETQLHGIEAELKRRGMDLEVEEHYGPSANPGHTDLKV